MSSYFWYAGGILTGLAATFIAIPLGRLFARAVPARGLRIGLSICAVVTFSATVLLVYRTLGRPDLVDGRVTKSAPLHAGARTPAPGEAVQSLDIAAAELEERIKREGGSASDWQLLAQSYEFLGRSDEAARARAHAISAPESDQAKPRPVTGNVGNAVAEYQARVQAAPRDSEAWLALATLYRQQRDFPKAREAFAKLIELRAMSADAWADYADVLGSISGGSLGGEAARAIDRALALDPKHVKALWLKASLAHEQQRYRESLALWKELRGLLPADSPDVRIIDSNIAEATQLSNLPVAQSADASTTGATNVQVTGTVSIDRKFAGRVPPGTTLFIYAKAADSPGPPLAVLRTATGTWPVSFRLDDSLAMMPARKLSAFDKVIVEARISRSGQAVRAPGDLYVVSSVLRPADGKPLQLVISREVS